MKRLTILGSTGSIGKSALDIVSSNRELFRVVAMTAGRNIDLLQEQIMAFSPQMVAVADESAAVELRRRIGLAVPEILSGDEGVAQVAMYSDSDFVLSAIVGAAGLVPTVSAIRSGKTIGLANKETMVMAGKIVTAESQRCGVQILPVDSEHSAVFQCIEGYIRSDVSRIILTASGGPFADSDGKNMESITPEEALRHPKWNMGKKITIDSATLMNKGLEVIEAHHLFCIPPDRIDVLIHPQSIVHSMVEFKDGCCMAQLSIPDMKGPIAYAMSYPERLRDILRPLDLSSISTLTFRKPNHDVFPCLSYAYMALEAGGTMPSVLNAANEVAVDAFLCGAIRFSEIPSVIRKTMDKHTVMPDTELPAILEADRWARETAGDLIRQ